MEKTKKARIGIIGLGMGKYHLRNYQAYERCEVVAICDNNESLLRSISKEFNVPHVYSSIDEMLDAPLNLNGVSVALPNYLHAPVTMKALKKGLHVLCEKPMAMNAQEAESMLVEARKDKKKLMINFSYRFIDHCMALKELIGKGIIGDVYYCRWPRADVQPRFEHRPSVRAALEGACNAKTRVRAPQTASEKSARPAARGKGPLVRWEGARQRAVRRWGPRSRARTQKSAFGASCRRGSFAAGRPAARADVRE